MARHGRWVSAASCAQPSESSSRPWRSTSGRPRPGQRRTCRRRPSPIRTSWASGALMAGKSACCNRNLNDRAAGCAVFPCRGAKSVRPGTFRSRAARDDTRPRGVGAARPARPTPGAATSKRHGVRKPALGQYGAAMADAAAFNALMGALNYPMFIVTVRHGEERSGCLIGFAGQVSIHPPRFMACLSVKTHTYRVASAGAERLAVHLVPAGALELAELFGGQTGDEIDKFERTGWREGPHGVPVLDECPSWFVGRVLDQVVLGDHVGFVLEPEAVQHEPEGGQMDFHRARGIDPGHAP